MNEKTERKRIAITGKDVNEQKCECCGWKEYPIALTLHHIFIKSVFIERPMFKRKFRYLLLCPNCHSLIHLGIYSKEMKKLIKERLDSAERSYPKDLFLINVCRKLYGLKESQI